MPAIGITGGISTGKSTFCRCLLELFPDASFFDADEAARLLTDNDAEVKKEVRDVFGQDIYSASGDLNRRELRAIIMKSAEKKRALEEILHPRIRRQWSAQAQTHRNSPDFFFADIPLLYESNGETLCDAVVVVACSPDVQLERLLVRIGAGGPLNRSEALQFVKSQMALEEKIKRADHVVWNNDGYGVLARQARHLARLWTTKLWIRK